VIRVDERLIAYLYYFNVKQDYYECHEYGEHLWLEEGRPVVLKGLIQAAVCLYHLQNGNLKGGYSMWKRAKSYVNDYRPVYEGIDLDKLTKDIDSVFAAVPEHFFGQVVPSIQIQQLYLPTVMISLNPEVEALLEDYCPKPLHDMYD
jgi:uncharacterized protein